MDLSNKDLTNMNAYDNDENIRPPDQTKRETLLDSSWYQPKTQEELDMEEAIRQSNDIAEQMENEQYQMFINKIEERKEEFKSILVKLNRLKQMDKTVEELFENVISIITHYTNCDIDNYEFDTETHDKIFKNFKTMRFNKDEMVSLSLLFKCE
jgi:septum formation topological specificity factor MinE